MQIFKKIIASALVLALAVPALTACSKKGSSDVISADDPWFDLNAVTIEEDFDPEVYEIAYMDYVGVCDQGYIYSAYAVKLIPDGFDIESDYADLIEQYLYIYNDQGEKTATIDISAYLRDSDLGEYTSMDGVVKLNDVWYVKISSYDINTYESVNYRVPVDLESGEFGEAQLLEAPDEITAALAEGASEESEHIVGDYQIRKFWMYAESGASYILMITDAEGNVTVLDLRDIFPNEVIYDISNFVDIGNNRALVCANDYNKDKYFVIDFTTMTIDLFDEDMSWLSIDSRGIYSVEGIGSAIIDQDGVYAIDFENRTTTPLILFDDTNVNRCDVGNFTPVVITEDECIFTGVPNTPDVGASSFINARAGIYTFTRADSNPNAGKTVVTVASVEAFTYPVCNAVCEFNDTSSEYFIKLDSKYSIDKHSSEINSEEDYQAARDRVSADLSNQLAIDLMAGEGPDVIINGASLNMLNSSDYLLDLAPYIQENCGSDNYFTNIFDACSDGEALYQAPLSFSVIGIATSEDNVEEGQIGFTFEQYQEFVSGPCNGVSPFSGTRIDIFIRLVDCMYDSFIEDGTVNFDTEEFRALAQFTADTINDDLTVDSDEGYYEEDSDVASIAYIDSITSYFQNVINKDFVLLGLPSYDGRGPVIYDVSSVAVSAQTDYQDACYEFVSMLLSDSCQETFGLYSTPVNRTAFNAIAEKYIEANNTEVSLMLRLYDEAMLTMLGYSVRTMDESDIPVFEQFVSGITDMYVNDGSINSIIREEMPSFFEGQKTLEQILPVLTDRVSTVLNERS